MVDIQYSELSDLSLLLPLPTFLPRRFQPGSLANWSGHLAFANDLIAQHRPSILVELGTHYGESYFGMCQSVAGNGLDCVCYAVDHWLGEEHAGKYGEEVFTDVNDYNQRFYRSFSYLLRSTFDDALQQFSDNSIDLLHIDGLHTYEAGLHDFQSWFPKVKPGGIVLIHDVMVRHANFGIWKMWEELQGRYSETFSFHHSWGLGVLRKPGLASRSSKFLERLFSDDEQTHEQIRRHYVLYSSYLDRSLAQDATSPADAASNDSSILMQVFLPTEDGYSESSSLRSEFPLNVSKSLQFEIPAGLSGSIRLDPSDRPGVLEIRSIELIDANLGTRYWSANTPSALKAEISLSHAQFLPQSHSCLILSYGTDPQISLPDLKHDKPLRLIINILVHSDLQLLSAFAPEQDIETLKGELRSAQSSRLLLAAEMSQLTNEKHALEREHKLLVAKKQVREQELGQLLEEARQQNEEEAQRFIGVNNTLSSVNNELTSVTKQLDGMAAALKGVESSVSWRLTKPLRGIMRVIRGGRSA